MNYGCQVKIRFAYGDVQVLRNITEIRWDPDHVMFGNIYDIGVAYCADDVTEFETILETEIADEAFGWEEFLVQEEERCLGSR